MRILAAVLVLQNAYLHIDCEHVVLLLTIEQLSAQWDDIPPRRFLQVEKLHLLEVLQMVARTNRNFVRSIRFVALEIQEYGEFLLLVCLST